MYTDIIFPGGNEKEFLDMAAKLGYSGIVFAYKRISDIPDLKTSSKIKILIGLLAEEKDIQKAKKHADIVLVKSSGNDRWVLEKSQADILFGLEEASRKDFMHHRASGLNQVLCKIASKKGKTIGFSFSSILKYDGMHRAQIIGRIMQNVRFCRKYKVKTILASFAQSPYEIRAPKDMISFGKIVGL